MLARLFIAFALLFALVYCQDCNVNGCTYNGATDRTGSSSVDVTFGSDLKYTPKCVRVNAGTTINYSGSFSSHPLVAGTFNNGKQPASGSPIPSTSTGTSASVTFNTNGTFPYYCDFHASSGMVGVVYVGNQCAGQSSPAGTHYVSFVAAVGAGIAALLF